MVDGSKGPMGFVAVDRSPLQTINYHVEWRPWAGQREKLGALGAFSTFSISTEEYGYSVCTSVGLSRNGLAQRKRKHYS